jgi:predicted AAA+ superfamily ATPase
MSDVLRGRLFELVVGLELLRLSGQVYYWRQDQVEVDFVYKRGSSLFAIEVKSGRKKSTHGLSLFQKHFEDSKVITITPENFSVFCLDPEAFLQKFAISST